MAIPIRHPYHKSLKFVVNIVLIGVMGTILALGQMGLDNWTAITVSSVLSICGAVLSIIVLRNESYDRLSTYLILSSLIAAAFGLVLYFGGIHGLILYALPLLVLFAAILTTSKETVIFSVALALSAVFAVEFSDNGYFHQTFGLIVLELWVMAFIGMLLIEFIDQQHQMQGQTIWKQLDTNAKLQWILECEERHSEQLFQRLSDNIRQEQLVFSQYHEQVSSMNPEHVLVKPIQLLDKQLQQLASYVDTEQSMAVQSRQTSMREVYQSMHALFEQHPEHEHVQVSLNLVYDEADHICVDLPRLEQVWINLFRNALRFTQVGEIRIDLLKEANRYRFQFFDTGCGIAVSEQNRIFQIFEQGKPGAHTEGLGIGLALSANILKQFGSRLFLKSIENKGTVFWFFIDIVAEDVP